MAVQAPPRRLDSLDAFRGFTVLGMLLVNNTAMGEATPSTLVHAPWNHGIHFADLVFPFFLFLVGVAIPFAARRSTPASILRRAFTLVALGCLLDSSLAQTPVLGLGVLQLIGLAYAGAALLAGLPSRTRLLLAGGLLLNHWAALRFLEVPGVGFGVLEEERNLVAWLNREWLASWHLQGLLSLVPTTGLALLGSCAGDLIKLTDRSEVRKSLLLVAWGAAAAALGWLWSIDLPFNKPLWTASYVVTSAGLGSLVLGLMHLVIDAWNWRRWAYPFRVMGQNALAAYVGPILFKGQILLRWTWPSSVGPDLNLQDTIQGCLRHELGPVAGGWAWTTGYMATAWIAVWWMSRKGIFWKA